jgi:hypothetical protein
MVLVMNLLPAPMGTSHTCTSNASGWVVPHSLHTDTLPTVPPVCLFAGTLPRRAGGLAVGDGAVHCRGLGDGNMEGTVPATLSAMTKLTYL